MSSNIDASGVITRNDVFARTIIKRYGASDAVDRSTLRKMHRVGEVELVDNQIKSKYKHADEFGVNGNNNPENREEFRKAIAEHAVNPNTKRIEGEYTRLEGDQSVTHLYNSNTGNNIIINDGEFLSGWKLNPMQRQDIQSSGVIGGPS